MFNRISNDGPGNIKNTENLKDSENINAPAPKLTPVVNKSDEIANKTLTNPHPAEVKQSEESPPRKASPIKNSTNTAFLKKTLSTAAASSAPLIQANAHHAPKVANQPIINKEDTVAFNATSKMFLPNVTLLVGEKTAVSDLKELQVRINQDREDMKISASSLKVLRDDPEGVKMICLETLDATEHLFTNPGDLKREVETYINDLVKNLGDSQQLKDIGFDPDKLKGYKYSQKEIDTIKDAAISKMSKNLGDYFYHTINHAKEMFFDTFVRLAEKNHPEHLCLEGALMGMEHDLIQGLGAFPSLGQNENITAKLVGSLMKKANPRADCEALVKASQDLFNATIVGGTLLVQIKKDGEDQYKAIAQFTDNAPFLGDQTLGSVEDRQFVLDLREALAINDVDRTRENYEIKAPPLKSSGFTRAIFNARNQGIATSKDAIRESLAAQRLSDAVVDPSTHEKVRENELSRLYQSIRIQGELAVKFNKIPGRTVVLHYFANPDSVTPEQRKQIEDFLKNLGDPAKWNGEKMFAKPSGHVEYLQFLNSADFQETMKPVTPEELALPGGQERAQEQVAFYRDLFWVAVQSGQVGEHLSNPSDVIRPQLQRDTAWE